MICMFFVLFRYGGDTEGNHQFLSQANEVLAPNPGSCELDNTLLHKQILSAPAKINSGNPNTELCQSFNGA